MGGGKYRSAGCSPRLPRAFTGSLLSPFSFLFAPLNLLSDTFFDTAAQEIENHVPYPIDYGLGHRAEQSHGPDGARDHADIKDGRYGTA